jgi:hypothetical protein
MTWATDPVVIPSWVASDPEWASAIHLLTSPCLRRIGAMRSVDFEREEIDVPGLLEMAAGSVSSGERAMLLAACDLFNGGGAADLRMLIHALDDSNLHMVIEAIEFRCGWRRLGDREKPLW